MKFKRTGFRRILPICLIFAAMAASIQAAFAQATASANATAYVAAPLTITKTHDLAFGAFVAGPGGTVLVNLTGGVVLTGVVQIASGTYVPSYATFSVTGAPNFVFTITLPTTATVTNGGGTMSISAFNSNPVSPVTMTAGGTSSFGVGATLTVTASQAPGAYTGTFNVTIAYQ